MQKFNDKIIYNGEIVAGSLLIRESRKIARLLLNNADSGEWHQAIVIENVLQKHRPDTAMRQARLIKNRLSLMTPKLWEIVDKGSMDIAVQAILAASIKHSRLLGDFMDKTLREYWRTFTKNISIKDWKDFLETCAQVDPKVDKWTDSTRSKLKQVVFRILAESKYIACTKSLRLLPVSIIPDIRKYLIENSEDYVLRCMEVTQ
ncbi:MAG: DUF1819 family protein [Desulfobacterales bacterium]|nr:DUF1819 family protein [Desulfobacterales bacterium]